MVATLFFVCSCRSDINVHFIFLKLFSLIKNRNMLTLSVPYPSPSCTELEGIVLKIRPWSLSQFVIFVFAFPFQIEIWSIRLMSNTAHAYLLRGIGIFH